VRVTLWDDKADLVEEFEAGEVVEVGDGYVRERDGDLELHVGDRGTVERVDEDVEYVLETTDIAELEIGDRRRHRRGSSSRRIRSARSTATTARKGRSGTSASRTTPAIRRVALWGDKADREIELADRVVFTDVEVQDGWQDDLEASANWRSTVTTVPTKGAMRWAAPLRVR